MEDERYYPESRSKVCPIVWAIFTAIAISLAVITGIAKVFFCLLFTCFFSNEGTAGYIAAKLPEDVSEMIPIYMQCATTFIFLVVSICETAAIVTLVRWIKCRMNLDKSRRRNSMVRKEKLLLLHACRLCLLAYKIIMQSYYHLTLVFFYILQCIDSD